MKNHFRLAAAMTLSVAMLSGAASAAVTAAGGATADAGPSATSWDGLVRVPSKNLKLVYMLPGADFRAYTKVMIDTPEVDFVKGWRQKMNDSYDFNMGTTSKADALQIAAAYRKGFDDILVKAFEKGGYQIATAPGPDVLRVSTALFNLYIAAPETVTATNENSVRTSEAGSVSLLIEVRDSESGQVLGRALDAQVAGINDEYLPRSTVTNRADFGQIAEQWARTAVKGLDKLKELSPVDKQGAPRAAAK